MLNNQQSQLILSSSTMIAVIIGGLGFIQIARADIQTLFSTPQERQIINANRYKTNEVVKQPRIEAKKTAFVVTVAREEVTMSFAISGIAIASSGPQSVWINKQIYEDGAHLEDNSHIKVISGENVRVRITTPDGKNYYGTSGETLEVTYLATIEN